MSRYSLRRPRLSMAKIAGLVAILLLIGLIATVITVRRNYYDNLRPVSASQQSKLFTVEPGATAAEIAVNLKKAGLIRQTWAFEWYVRNHNLRDKLQAGSYYIQPSQSVSEIADILTKGKVATDLFTILPGKRIDQIKASMVNAGFDPTEVEQAFDPALYKDHPALVDKPAGASLEGYLYPESFQKHTETKPTTIITASLNEMQKRLTPSVRAAFVQQGLTVHQGVILASIVEQEVSKPADRPTVAQVFLKRLHMNMQLGSDVTAFYGSIINNKSPSVLYDSPYNTRIHTGFPPGPISNVTASSLQAVANPAKTDYLYFVAGDDGNTYFSNTLQEHEALTKEHCKKLCNE
jgi:UPF0755 protein